MIEYDEVLNMNYYKKTSFSGWTDNMRFLIRREQPEDEEAFFHVYAWPGPLIFDKVDEINKLDARFPFTEEGKKQCVDWLNEQLSENADFFQKR